MTMDDITFTSSKYGSKLKFGERKDLIGEIEFEVSVVTPYFSGRSVASTFVNSDPSALFSEMAREWRGWQGEKIWQDLESRVSLKAVADSTGHIFLTVELQGNNFETSLRSVLEFESGQLETIAVAAEEWFRKS